jgi:hypothetical protein
MSMQIPTRRTSMTSNDENADADAGAETAIGPPAADETELAALRRQREMRRPEGRFADAVVNRCGVPDPLVGKIPSDVRRATPAAVACWLPIANPSRVPALVTWSLAPTTPAGQATQTIADAARATASTVGVYSG